MLNIWMQRNGAGLLSLQLLPAVCAPADGTPLPLRALSLGCVTTQKGVSSRSDVTSLAAGDSAAYCPTARQWRANSLTHPRRGSCFFYFFYYTVVTLCRAAPSHFPFFSSTVITRQKLDQANQFGGAPLTSTGRPKGHWPDLRDMHLQRLKIPNTTRGPPHLRGPPVSKEGLLAISIIPLFHPMQRPHCWYNPEAFCMLSDYHAPKLLM